jgi:large repetitive protein
VLEVEDPNQFLMAEAELIANPDHAFTDELNSVIIDVLDNDFHPDDEDLTVVFADVPNGQGSVTIVDGQYLVYDPGTDFDYLALGETTDVVITYVVSDSTGAIASTTVTVTLTGINQAPVIAPVGETSLVEQTDTQPLNATIAVTFTDVDLNNVGHEAAVVGVAVNGETGGLTLDDAALMALVSPGTVIKNAGDSNGSVDFFFTAAFSVFDYLAEGEVVTLTYTFEIDDGDGGTTLQTFDVTITGTNDAPVIDELLSDVAATVVEDGFDANGNPIGNPNASGQIQASDVDNGGKTFSVAQTNGTFGVFAINAAGEWTYTLDDAAADRLALGQTKTEVFKVIVTDGFGATDEVLVTITVVGANDAPRVSNVALSATEDGPAVLAGFAGGDRDSDDNTGSLTYNVTQPSEGTVINHGDGTFSFDPGDDFQDLGEGVTRQVTFTYTATDRHGLVSDPATVTVTVTGTNDIPVVSGVSTGAVTEDAHPTTLTTGGVLTIVDPDAGESNFAPQSNVSGTYGTFTLLANGTWSYSADNTQLAIQSLRAGDQLTDSFTAVSSDGTVTQQVTVTIHGVNDIATIIGNAAGNVEEDVTTQASGTLTVLDIDSGENVFQAVPAANLVGTYGSFTFNELTGQWTYTLDNDAAHVQALRDGQEVTDTLVVTSFDGTDSQTITVTITGTADDATITGTATGTVTEDGASDGNPSTVQVVTGTLTVSDPDSGENVFQAVPAANLVGTYGIFTFNELTGQWTYTLDNKAANVQALGAGQEVTDTLVVTSFDGSANETIRVTIVGSNDAPVISVVGNDSDGAVLTADEATPTSFLMDIDSGDPIYTSGQMATVTFFISRGEGQAPEEVTVEFLMGPSHVATLANLIDAINAADNGLRHSTPTMPSSSRCTWMVARSISTTSAQYSPIRTSMARTSSNWGWWRLSNRAPMRRGCRRRAR